MNAATKELEEKAKAAKTASKRLAFFLWKLKTRLCLTSLKPLSPEKTKS